MALRLEDEDDRISSLARLFFHELSKKGSNPIYNLLPDILGKLSCQNVKEESFCNIMQFLIGSIKKDKQMESLVEKLCNRFTGVSDVRQWEYISYCLSQLAFTEKSMRKLMDSFKTYAHVLSEGTVVDHLKTIINKVKKFAKPELKASIEEYEEKINKCHSEKKEQLLVEQNAQQHQQKVDQTLNFITAKKEVEDSDESEITEEVEENRSKSTTKASSLSGASTLLTETEPDEDEVQSPLVHLTGASRSKMKKSCRGSRNVSGHGQTSTRRKQTSTKHHPSLSR